MRRFVVARNEWVAEWLTKKVERGRAPTSVLHKTQAAAHKEIDRKRDIDRVKFRVFEVDYNADTRNR